MKKRRMTNKLCMTLMATTLSNKQQRQPPPPNHNLHREDEGGNLANPEKTYIDTEEADNNSIKQHPSIKKEGAGHQPLQPVNNHNSLPTTTKLSDGAGEQTGEAADRKNTSGLPHFLPDLNNLVSEEVDREVVEEIINDDEMFAADIWIENGIVKKISSQQLKAPEGAQVIEANGRWVLPAESMFTHNSPQIALLQISLLVLKLLWLEAPLL
uniref:Uncharacterized protein n=1 Tax=Ditylenchus dipsaci TaxID=166011 RepID=A0A915CTH8_9BILA